ncbi:MAG TPA: MATE family efflux transporter [Firmicutes bacterium]|nr:MATE family efflux transporter [Bacillota bacterium]
MIPKGNLALDSDAEAGTVELAATPSTKEIRWRVWDLSAPALVEMMLNSLVGMADMMMVGRLGSAAIAAVGFTNQPVFFLLAIFRALNVGTTALIARFVGARRPDRANDTLRMGFAITLLLGILLSLFSYATAPMIIAALGAEEEVLPLGIAYMRLISLGMLFQAGSMALNSALRGAGDTKTPMTTNVTANIVNVVGNYILIYGHFGFPALGIRGAAMATNIARVLGCSMALYVVMRKNPIIRLSLAPPYRLDFGLLQRLIRIGLPAAGEQLVLRTGQILYLRIVAGLGTATVAAHQIGMNILSLSFMPGQAFAIAATTLVGQYLGSKRPDTAQKSALETRKLGMIVSCSVAVLLFFGGAQIARLYTDEMEVIAQTALVLKIIALIQPAQSTQFILAGGLRGAGDTRWPLVASFIGIWGVRVAVGYLLVAWFHLGLVGAWTGMALDQCTRSVLIWTRFKRGRWKSIAV